MNEANAFCFTAWLKPSSILCAVELKWTGGAILLGAGGLTFIYDTAVFSNYSGAISDPDSDGGKARVLLKKRASSFLQPAARIRMVHLTDNSKRNELMIIYGETLDGKAPPNSGEGLANDEQFPELAARVRPHAVEGMKIERR